MTDTIDVLGEVEYERTRQDKKFGVQDHPDLCQTLVNREGGATPERHAEDVGIPSANVARTACQNAFAQKRGTWALIAVEELAEAVEAAALGNQEKLRTELIQCAAVFVAWVESLDRRKKNGT